MKDGFITVACGSPPLRLADCDYNAEQTFTLMRTAEKAGVKILVLPELGLTGYTCGDLSGAQNKPSPPSCPPHGTWR